MYVYELSFNAKLERTVIVLYQPLKVSNNVAIESYETVRQTHLIMIAVITLDCQHYNMFTNHLIWSRYTL